MKRIIKLFVAFTMLTSFSVFAKPSIELYKSPSCGCCTGWADIMVEKGYVVEVQAMQEWQHVKQEFGMPGKLMSCHTAVIDGYLIEGHVPEKDIARLLAERPADIAGIAAPGMPQHSPGMARHGAEYKDFAVVAFDKGGNTSLYQQY